MEMQIEIAHKLYRARRAARNICGENYAERISPYQEVIREQMSLYNNNELETVLALAPKLVGTESEVFGTILLLAAAVEMIEPSNNNPKNS